MTTLICWVALTLFISENLSASTQGETESDILSMFIGTYTDNSESKGIYKVLFNQKNGQYEIADAIEVGQPSFLCFSPDKKHIYSVSEYADSKAAANAFTFNGSFWEKTDNQYNSPDGQRGEDPCHLWTNGHHLVTANYSGGSLSVFKLLDNGNKLFLEDRITFLPLHEKAISHIHCALPTPDGSFLFVTDLGNDCIYRYTINTSDNNSHSPFLSDRRIVYNGPEGWGPRHFTFSQDGRYMYLINELGGTIVVFRYMQGTLIPIQHLTAEEVPAHGSADIHISPNGRFLYASHRLKNDGISIYKINTTTGRIKKIGYQKTSKHPRNFSLTPNGRYLLAACRDDNCIDIFKCNPHTGLLENTNVKISLPKPVCIIM